MRTLLATAAVAALVLAASGPANAEYARCSQFIEGKGHSHIAETREDIGPPKGGVSADALARRRAIANWSQKVRIQCPRYSTYFWRARDKHIECDAGAGNRDCVVRARPAHKILG